MIVCPWCGTNYIAFQSNCSKCGGPIQAPRTVTSTERTEEVVMAPPPPREISDSYRWKIMLADSWSVAAGIFALLGAIFSVVGFFLTIAIITAFVGIPFLGMGLLFLGGGGYVLYWRYNEALKAMNILRNGEGVLGQVTGAQVNYNVAVNASNKVIHTYMGVLKPNLNSASYSSAGQLSPLLKDPTYRTIGIGTRIFLGGGIGYVSWNGTQHNPSVPRSPDGLPRAGAGTLAVTGDAKKMNADYLRGASFAGYGATLFVGLGIPIPVLDEEMAYFTSRSDEDFYAQVVDYSHDYPERIPNSLCEVTYAELKSGKISLNGKEVPTNPISSYSKAREIASLLKDWINAGTEGLC